MIPVQYVDFFAADLEQWDEYVQFRKDMARFYEAVREAALKKERARVLKALDNA